MTLFYPFLRAGSCGIPLSIGGKSFPRPQLPRESQACKQTRRSSLKRFIFIGLRVPMREVWVYRRWPNSGRLIAIAWYVL